MKLVYRQYFPKGTSNIRVDPETGVYDYKRNLYIFEMNSVDMRRRSQTYPKDFKDLKDIMELFDLFGAKKIIIKHFLDPVTHKENGGRIEMYKWVD